MGDFIYGQPLTAINLLSINYFSPLFLPAHERFVLAQKYGYELPEITDDILLESKDPRQVFFGLHPGWLINLADKEIYKPNDKELLDYYNS